MPHNRCEAKCNLAILGGKQSATQQYQVANKVLLRQFRWQTKSYLVILGGKQSATQPYQVGNKVPLSNIRWNKILLKGPVAQLPTRIHHYALSCVTFYKKNLGQSGKKYFFVETPCFLGSIFCQEREKNTFRVIRAKQSTHFGSQTFEKS